MTALSDEQLAAIRARADAATPGPWKHWNDPGARWVVDVHDSSRWIARPVWDEADSEFIAHSRTDIPRLLAEIDRLQQYADLLERGLSAHEARSTVWSVEAHVT